MSELHTSAAGAHLLAERYTELLTQWPLPAEQLRVDTRHGETFVVASGPRDAPPLVLLHGSRSNNVTWIDEVALWARHFRTYAIDIIGEPGLSAPTRPPLKSNAHVLWLTDVLDALGVERAAFVGTSLGGWIALEHAIRHPERVERLALRCPSGIGRQKFGVILAAPLLMPWGRWGRRTMLNLAIGPTPSGPTSDRQNAVGDYALLIQRHFRPRRGKLPVLSDTALRALGALTLPVQVTVGERDRLVDSRHTQRRLRRTAPHVPVTVVPGMGHLIQGQTQPVLDFLLAAEGTPHHD